MGIEKFMCVESVSRALVSKNAVTNKLRYIGPYVCDAYLAGKSAGAVGERFGLSEHSVVRILESHGVARRHPKKKRVLAKCV